MKKLIAALAVAVALAGCSKEPLSSVKTNNQQFDVAELFTHDGITVYRFNDGGRYVYFGAKGGDAFATRQESCGKNCTRNATTPTIGAN